MKSFLFSTMALGSAIAASASTCEDAAGNKGDCKPGLEFCGTPFANAPSYHLMDQHVSLNLLERMPLYPLLQEECVTVVAASATLQHRSPSAVDISLSLLYPFLTESQHNYRT